MDQRLKADLRRLQTNHAIDDSLIESLLTSPQQALAHLTFWKRMMWGVNGGLIGIGVLMGGFAMTRLMAGGAMAWGGVLIVSISLSLYITVVLRRQQLALSHILKTARQYDLI